ncbi:MAG: hypothetical protein EXR69_04260 [Myxococcales bacterium]|nr:hypothetical protein [Myxococcales bacterium]
MILLLIVGCAGPDTGTQDSASSAPFACVPELPELDLADAVVGYRYEPHDYALPWDDSARTIGMNVWYPTEAPTAEGASYIGLWNDPDSRVDSPVAPSECTRPVVIYSHGSQAWGGSAHALMRQFVRNGWVAVAPDHTGNLLTDNLDPRPTIYPLVRATDIVESLEWVADLPASDPLSSRVDTSRVLVIGHSFGGQTSWLLSGVGFNADGVADLCTANPCSPEEQAAFGTPAGDDRIVGVIPMAGSADAQLVDDSTWGAVHTPILYMTGSEDNDGSEPYARSAAADVRWAEIDGGCHESFTSTDLACDTLPKDEGTEIVAAYATAFGWATVLESDAAEIAGVLEGSVVVSERVSLSRSR